MNKNKPPIIIGDELISILDNGIKTLDHLVANLTEYENLDGLSAAYLYGYSIFESTIFKIYYRVLRAFPEKAEFEYNKINKELLFGTSRTSVIIEYLCKEFTHNFSHDNFSRYIKTFNNIVGIDLASAQFPVKKLDEYKNIRNHIAHKGGSVSIEDAKQHIKAIKNTIALIRDKFIPKYSKFTDIELIKKSCAYIFGMSQREFNECFEFLDGHVRIKLEPIENFYGRLCSSEAHCFLLFIVNYNASLSPEFKIGHLMPRVSLTDDTIDRISFINDLFDAYPYLINR